jgi:hypothetical protein
MAHTYDDLNMADVLGEGAPERLACPRCNRIGPPSTMKHVAGCDHFQTTFVCGQCFLKRIYETGSPPAIPDDWSDTEPANNVRAERNRRLNECVWTVLPGSPLTETCQADWAAYRAALNAITVTFAGPSMVVWPTAPGLEY